MRVSVIVPAHNAAPTLGRTLDALLAQDLPDPYEVIVVDDGSADSTPAVLARFPSVRAIHLEQPTGPGPARNTGADEATGEWLAFTDADCFPATDWLSRGLGLSAGVELIQGSVRPDSGVSARPFDRSVWVVGEAGLYETANLFVRRDWFERIGGFEDWLGARIGKPLAEDVWLGWRLRRAGARSTYNESALVEHAVFRRSPSEFASERLRLTYFPDIVQKMPELRDRFLWRRVFLNRRTAAFDMALAGAVASPLSGSPVPLVACLPYVRLLARSSLRWGRGAARVGLTELIADSIGCAALAAGSVRRRTPVL